MNLNTIELSCSCIYEISFDDFKNWYLSNSEVVLKMKKFIINKMIKKRDKDPNVNIFKMF